jgi:hypothetical protein
MIKKSLGTRALQIAGGFALCTTAITAQADPFTLQGVCRLTNINAGQGQCMIEFVLTDGFVTPANVKVAVVKVDGLVVQRYVNDNVNPATSNVSYVSGASGVTCGAPHVVTAFITRLGVGTVSEKVGSLPAVACPPAQ